VNSRTGDSSIDIRATVVPHQSFARDPVP